MENKQYFRSFHRIVDDSKRKTFNYADVINGPIVFDVHWLKRGHADCALKKNPV